MPRSQDRIHKARRVPNQQIPRPVKLPTDERPVRHDVEIAGPAPAFQEFLVLLARLDLALPVFPSFRPRHPANPFRIRNQPDTSQPTGQRDMPQPPVLHSHHVHVPRVRWLHVVQHVRQRRWPPVVMPEQRHVPQILVVLPQPELTPQHRPLARSVHAHPGSNLARRSVLVRERQPRHPPVRQVRARHLVTFPNVHPLVPRMIQQQLVKHLAVALERERPVLRHLREPNRPWVPAPPPDIRRPVLLREPGFFDSLQCPRLAQRKQHPRQHRFAHMRTRKPLPLQQRHPIPLLPQQRRHRRPRRPPANHRHITLNSPHSNRPHEMLTSVCQMKPSSTPGQPGRLPASEGSVTELSSGLPSAAAALQRREYLSASQPLLAGARPKGALMS